MQLKRAIVNTLSSLCLAALPAIAAAQTLPTFRVTNLSTTPAAALCSPTAINDAGLVAGSCASADPFNYGAVVWRDGTVVDLGKLPGGNYAGPTAVNSLGVVVGDGDTGNIQPHAFVTYNGRLLDVDNIGGGANVRAIGITDTGVIFGNLTKSNSGNTASWKPVMWTRDPGKPDRYRETFLPKYPGGDSKYNGAYALASNKAGQAVGWVTTSIIGQLGAFWNNDSAHSVVTLAPLPNGTHTIAWAMSDLGVAVGESNVPGAYMRAVLWQNDGAHTPVEIGTLPGDFESVATAVNNAGQVIGWSAQTIFAPSYARAFFYQGGTMVELASLIDPTDGVRTIDAVFGMNNAGQIIAGGSSNGTRAALLLTPVAP